MTDAELDRRLRAAGERWRAGEADLAPPAPARRGPWLLLASAAVVAAALVAGGVALWSGGGDGSPRAAASTRPAGPAGPGRPAAPTIGTGTWHAVSVADRGGAPTGSDARLVLAHGRFTGSDGCNGIHGTARVGAHTITFRHTGVSTLIGCLGAGTVDSVLDGTVRYTVTATRLTLVKAGVGQVVYARTAAPPSPAGRWRLTSVQTTLEQGGTSSGSGSTALAGLTLTIGPDGRLTLGLRCAVVTGRVLQSRLTGVARAEHSCPSAPRTPDTQLNAIIVNGALVRATQDGLTVMQGPRSAVFVRAP